MITPWPFGLRSIHGLHSSSYAARPIATSHRPCAAASRQACSTTALSVVGLRLSMGRFLSCAYGAGGCSDPPAPLCVSSALHRLAPTLSIHDLHSVVNRQSSVDAM